ncbi:hypothetical protein GCM10028824_17170 [Hymenobacter segetis]
MSQRAFMIALADRIGRNNQERVIEAYANAERRGEIARGSNIYAKSSETYARGLWNDGMRKGWLRHPSQL